MSYAPEPGATFWLGKDTDVVGVTVVGTAETIGPAIEADAATAKQTATAFLLRNLTEVFMEKPLRNLRIRYPHRNKVAGCDFRHGILSKRGARSEKDHTISHLRNSTGVAPNPAVKPADTFSSDSGFDRSALADKVRKTVFLMTSERKRRFWLQSAELSTKKARLSGLFTTETDLKRVLHAPNRPPEARYPEWPRYPGPESTRLDPK